MKTLYMKIHEFEENSLSLIASFASDETKSQNPEDYPRMAFQPSIMWPGVTDLSEIKKRIAVAGMWHAEQQARREALDTDEERITALKTLVGQASFPVVDLMPNEFPNEVSL